MAKILKWKWYCAGPLGPPGHKGFLCPPIIGNSLHSASMTFPDFQWADSSSCFFFFFFFFIYLFILFFNFTILYWFCHISTWIHHRYTRVPHPEPSSLFPPHTIPLGKGLDRRPRRNNQERPWGKVLFPHQCIHTITLSYFAETESPSRWEQLMINDGMLPKSL